MIIVSWSLWVYAWWCSKSAELTRLIIYIMTLSIYIGYSNYWSTFNLKKKIRKKDPRESSNNDTLGNFASASLYFVSDLPIMLRVHLENNTNYITLWMCWILHDLHLWRKVSEVSFLVHRIVWIRSVFLWVIYFAPTFLNLRHRWRTCGIQAVVQLTARLGKTNILSN